MRKGITCAAVKVKRVLKSINDFLSETFHFGFTVKSRKDPENPLLDVKVSGHVPAGVKNFFTVLGILAAACLLLKILFRIH